MPNQNVQLTEEDALSIVLSDLKRVVREYATAATESSCPNVRQMFTQLLNSTLTMQGQLYMAMSNNNMYEQPAVAPIQEIQKQVQSYTQTATQTENWLNQIQ